MLASLPALAPRAAAQLESRSIANRVFARAFEHKLAGKPMGEVIAFVGREFLGAPYEAHTLDREGPEALVCNLRSFDCVTFVENVLALARCIKHDRLSYEAYEGELQKIRYRGGTISGYGSRLHYFSDWIADNAAKGIVTDVTRSLGGVRLRKRIDFMTEHRSAYPKLDSSAAALIRGREESLSSRELFYIPKKAVARISGRLQSGDLLAITTATEGLDVSHTGIAVKLEDGSLHYLHAPDVSGAVQITAKPLADYLKGHRAQTGIMVVRAAE